MSAKPGNEGKKGGGGWRELPHGFDGQPGATPPPSGAEDGEAWILEGFDEEDTQAGARPAGGRKGSAADQLAARLGAKPPTPTPAPAPTDAAPTDAAPDAGASSVAPSELLQDGLPVDPSVPGPDPTRIETFTPVGPTGFRTEGRSAWAGDDLSATQLGMDLADEERALREMELGFTSSNEDEEFTLVGGDEEGRQAAGAAPSAEEGAPTPGVDLTEAAAAALAAAAAGESIADSLRAHGLGDAVTDAVTGDDQDQTAPGGTEDGLAAALDAAEADGAAAPEGDDAAFDAAPADDNEAEASSEGTGDESAAADGVLADEVAGELPVDEEALAEAEGLEDAEPFDDSETQAADDLAETPADAATQPLIDNLDALEAAEAAASGEELGDTQAADGTEPSDAVVAGSEDEATAADVLLADAAIADLTIEDAAGADAATDGLATDETVTDATVTDATVTEETVTDETVTDETAEAQPEDALPEAAAADEPAGDEADAEAAADEAVIPALPPRRRGRSWALTSAAAVLMLFGAVVAVALPWRQAPQEPTPVAQPRPQPVEAHKVVRTEIPRPVTSLALTPPVVTLVTPVDGQPVARGPEPGPASQPGTVAQTGPASQPGTVPQPGGVAPVATSGADEVLTALDKAMAGIPTLPAGAPGVTPAPAPGAGADGGPLLTLQTGSRALALLQTGAFVIGKVKRLDASMVTLHLGSGELTLVRGELKQLIPLGNAEFQELAQGGSVLLKNRNRLVGQILQGQAQDSVTLDLQTAKITIPREDIVEVTTRPPAPIEFGKEDDETWYKKQLEKDRERARRASRNLDNLREEGEGPAIRVLGTVEPPPAGRK